MNVLFFVRKLDFDRLKGWAFRESPTNLWGKSVLRSDFLCYLCGVKKTL